MSGTIGIISKSEINSDFAIRKKTQRNIFFLCPREQVMFHSLMGCLLCQGYFETEGNNTSSP